MRRPAKDRPLYSLFYATRHSTGLEVFRDSLITGRAFLAHQSSANSSITDYLNKGAGVSSNAIHVYINRLRKLLEHIGATAGVKAVKIIEYMIKEAR